MRDRPDGPSLRILDANANRAREALRVLEDYARFSLNNQAVSADLKAIRHGMAAALGEVLTEAISHRDTSGDVGTGNKRESEFSREGLGDVVIAAGKRLGEALRVLEEVSKTIDTTIAAQIEQLRYRFYVIEQTLAFTLRSADRMAGVRLYVLISQDHCLSRPWQDVARAAIAGGAQCLQLREKSLEGGEFLRRAREFVDICRNANVISIINDRIDIAIASAADGVHVGQEDVPARDVRRLVGNERIVGVSTNCIAQARQAVLDSADYIGVGPTFRSTTKTRDFVAGLEYAAEVARDIHLPAAAIAGITLENLPEVLATGIRCVAVTAAITEQANVESAARAFRRLLDREEV